MSRQVRAAAREANSMSESGEKNLLFGDFPRVSKGEWKKEAERTLGKGRSYADLERETEDAIAVEPLYTRKEAAEFFLRQDCPPGEFPFVRGTRREGNAWLVSEDVRAADATEAARQALAATRGGADSVIFHLEGKIGRRDMEILTGNLDPLATRVSFDVAEDPGKTASLFVSSCERRDVDPAKLAGDVFFDPAGLLLAGGESPLSFRERLGETAETIVYLSAVAPGYGAFSVKSATFKDAGATVVQELAFTLAAAVECLVGLRALGVGTDDACRHLVFSFSAGSGYFEEIAKLRAARVLWANIAKRFSPADPSSGKMRIHCRTSRFNKTVRDPHVNMLRATTEAMASVIGGAESLAVDPFDIHSGEPDGFSRRVARNVGLLIRHESRLDAVADPGGGSYHLEKLTRETAQKSLELFQRVEAEGGFLECARSGFVQDAVERSGEKATDDVRSGKRVFVGTNEFADPLEKIPDGVFGETEEPAKSGPAGVRPLRPSRATGRFERERALPERSAEKTEEVSP